MSKRDRHRAKVALRAAMNHQVRDPGRTPPVSVQRQLRQEVGFRCPVPGCGNPYLSWHHFNPPWRHEHHHRPEDMIALCLDHAAKADGDAYSPELLRGWKKSGQAQAKAIEGKFEWMRHDYLAVIGSNFYYKNATILQIGDRRCIWFGRDADGYQFMNFWMPTTAAEPRARIFENGWVVPPTIRDMECPPTGKRLKVWYANGDRIAFEFFDVEGARQLVDRYPATKDWRDYVSFPTTVVEISERAAGSPIEFGPTKTTLPGQNIIRDSFIGSSGVAIQIGPVPQIHAPPLDDQA